MLYYVLSEVSENKFIDYFLESPKRDGLFSILSGKMFFLGEVFWFEMVGWS